MQFARRALISSDSCSDADPGPCEHGWMAATAVASPLIDSPSHSGSPAKPATDRHATIDPPSIEPPGIESPAIEQPGIEPHGIEPPGGPPAIQAIEPPGIEPPAIEPPAIERSSRPTDCSLCPATGYGACEARKLRTRPAT